MRLALGSHDRRPAAHRIVECRRQPHTLDSSLERIRTTAQRLSNELEAIRFTVLNDTEPSA
jgi:hypothetical protein